MKTKIFAVILIVLCSITALTACGEEDNSAKIEQIKTIYMDVLKDATDVGMLLVTAASSGNDVKALSDAYSSYMKIISGLQLDALSDYNSQQLDSLIFQLEGFLPFLADMKESVQQIIDQTAKNIRIGTIAGYCI